MRRRAVRVAHVVKAVEEGDEIEASLQIIGWQGVPTYWSGVPAAAPSTIPSLAEWRGPSVARQRAEAGASILTDRAGGGPRRPEEHCMDRGDAIGAVAPQLCVSGRCVMGPDLHREGAAGEGEPAGDSLIGL